MVWEELMASIADLICLHNLVNLLYRYLLLSISNIYYFLSPIFHLFYLHFPMSFTLYMFCYPSNLFHLLLTLWQVLDSCSSCQVEKCQIGPLLHICLCSILIRYVTNEQKLPFKKMKGSTILFPVFFFSISIFLLLIGLYI